MKCRALFLDRDGTINIEKEFISDPGELELIPGAPDALRLAVSHGFKLFVISNQSGIARGLMVEDDVKRVNARLVELLAEEGVSLDAIEYCPHYPPITGPCNCRKPKRGMIDRLLTRFDIDLERSFVIGDRLLDVELAANVGAGAILVMTGYGEIELTEIPASRQPDYVATDLLHAVQWIIEHD
jgi:histidinol-phosphate phosphatase family protein